MRAGGPENVFTTPFEFSEFSKSRFDAEKLLPSSSEYSLTEESFFLNQSISLNVIILGKNLRNVAYFRSSTIVISDDNPKLLIDLDNNLASFITESHLFSTTSDCLLQDLMKNSAFYTKTIRKRLTVPLSDEKSVVVLLDCVISEFQNKTGLM
ncbi:unnamed protein product, partial [Didymodactylos carnosus]